MNSCVYKKLGTFSVISGEDGQIVDTNIVGKNIIVRVVGGSLARDGVLYGTYPSSITVDKNSGVIRWKGIKLDSLTLGEDGYEETVFSKKLCIVYEYGWF